MTNPSNHIPEQRIKELEQQFVLLIQKAQFFEIVVKALKRNHPVHLVKSDSTSQQACLFLGINRRAYYKCNRVADLLHTQKF